MTIQEYCRKMSTGQLQHLLRNECNGHNTLAEDVIVEIFRVLAERDPEKPAVRDSLLSLCHLYWDD